MAIKMALTVTSCLSGVIFGAGAIRRARENYQRRDVSASGAMVPLSEAASLQKEEDIMQCLQLTVAVLLASTICASACQVEVVDSAYGWVRSRPNLYANQLWKLQEGVKVVYCGRSAIDDRNIEWRWIAFAYDQEQWPHKGWVSARILSPDVPVIVPRVMHEPTFEEGGE